MKRIIWLLLCVFFISCDNDKYVTYKKSKEFEVVRLKKTGKSKKRGFYVIFNNNEEKVKYRYIRNGDINIGDKVVLNYDSIVNLTKSTYYLSLQYRFK